MSKGLLPINEIQALPRRGITEEIAENLGMVLANT